jgi:hypothetical protein
MDSCDTPLNTWRYLAVGGWGKPLVIPDEYLGGNSGKLLRTANHK